MKKITRIICLILGVCVLALSFASCTREAGLYAWYGGKMKVDNVFKVTCDAGDGEVTYDVPFSLYRAIFLYGVHNVSNVYVDDDNVQKLVSVDEQTKAVKEYTEDVLSSYYSLMALADHFGIGLTDADRESYAADRKNKIAEYSVKIDASTLKKGQTVEERAEENYTKNLASLGMTKEYVEYSFYKALLEKRIKAYLYPDIVSYINQIYFRYEQVYIVYTRGDKAAEDEAYEKILEASKGIENGEAISTLAAKYGNSVYDSEIYFDITGSIVGNSEGLTVTSVIEQMVKALGSGETSGILMGDYDDYNSYYAIIKRQPITKDFILGNSSIAQTMYQYPYIDSASDSAHYTTYTEYLQMYSQNLRLDPVSQKVYDRIAVNTLY